jgi:predicted nucleic acid-binding protein
MKFVVDTNILFSAVLNTQSKIGDLMMNSQGIFEFYACDTLRSELKRHRASLLNLSQLNDEQLDQSIFQISNCINFTSEALIPFEYWLKGAELVRDTDWMILPFLP